jgi:hypothetical protein
MSKNLEKKPLYISPKGRLEETSFEVEIINYD